MAEVSNLIPLSKAEEDNRIKALVNTPALDWQHMPCPNGSRGVIGGRMVRGHGYGLPQKLSRHSYVWCRTMNKADVYNTIKAPADIGGHSSGLQNNKVPPGYVCHRCNVPGHLIKHCPTNDDPNYDIKRVAPPTGIPRSMLIAASDGSYVLPTGALVAVKPDEATFEKEMEGIIPSTLPLSGPEIPSSASLDESKREQKVSPDNEEETKVQETLCSPEKKLEDVKASSLSHDDDLSKASQYRRQLVKEEAHPIEEEFEWEAAQGYGAENNMMMAGYNLNWNGMQGFGAPLPLPYEGAMQMMNNYGLGPFHMMMPFGNLMPEFPFGFNNCIFPPSDITGDQEVNSSADISSMTMKSKPTQIPPSSVRTIIPHDYPQQLSSDQYSSKEQRTHPCKRKSEYYSDDDRSRDHDQDYGYIDHECRRRRHRRQSKSSTRPATESITERRHKADDFSGRSVPEWEVSKKRKLTTSCLTEPARKLATSTTTYHKAIPARGDGGKKSTVDYRSCDDERHYNRRLPKASWEEERRHRHKQRYY